MKITRIGLLFILGALILIQAPSDQMFGQMTARSAQPPADASAPPAVPNSALRADMDFGRMPLYFVSNQGQIDRRVAYYVQGQDKTQYFTPGGLTIALSGKGSREGRVEKTGSRWAVKLEFIDSNPGVKVIAKGETGAVISYFSGKPAEWRPGIPTYSKIVYQELWPGIDLAYSGTTNRLKYEFIVRPGADPKAIRLRYQGADEVKLTGDGELEVRTPLGAFRDDAPTAYQEAEDGRALVAASYLLDETSNAGERSSEAKEKKATDFEYGFQVGEYDRRKPLILDPAVLLYCGFIGGSGVDYGYGIAVDGSGNAYVTGATDSSAASFPETVGPDLTHNGDYDAFVAKIQAATERRLLGADIDGDGEDEVIADLAMQGLWSWDQAVWTLLSASDPEAFVAANVDVDAADEIVADFASLGAWVWNGGWTQLSGANPDGMAAADVDGSGDEEIVADFGTIGLWSWDSVWSQMSALNAESSAAANIDAEAADELVVDFGVAGIWLWNDGVWSQIR